VFPIQKDKIAKCFIEQISPIYKFPFLLPPTIMTANPADKPWLPDDLQLINEYNITTPITSRKQLVDVARMLRENYYFYRISDAWIQINESMDKPNEENLEPDKKQQPDKPIILDTPLAILEYLKTKNIDTAQLTIPITEQVKADKTLEFLRQHFTIRNIPDNLLALPPLPAPNWDIFKPPSSQ
jgi:hypothetical protein